MLSADCFFELNDKKRSWRLRLRLFRPMYAEANMGHPSQTGNPGGGLRFLSPGRTPSLLQQLVHGAIRFGDGSAVIHDSRKIGIGEGDFAERSAPHYLSGSDLALRPKEEAWLATEIRVAPTIYDDAGDIPPRIKTAARKHQSHLLANHSLIFRVRGAQQAHPSPRALLRQWNARLGKRDFHTEHGWIVGGDGGRNIPEYCDFANCEPGVEPLETLAFRDPHLGHEAPVAYSNVDDGARHAVELLVGSAIVFRQIGNGPCGCPARGHHHRSRVYGV